VAPEFLIAQVEHEKLCLSGDIESGGLDDHVITGRVKPAQSQKAISRVQRGIPQETEYEICLGSLGEGHVADRSLSSSRMITTHTADCS
jgi:hypothetical protein